MKKKDHGICDDVSEGGRDDVPCAVRTACERWKRARSGAGAGPMCAKKPGDDGDPDPAGEQDVLDLIVVLWAAFYRKKKIGPVVCMEEEEGRVVGNKSWVLSYEKKINPKLTTNWFEVEIRNNSANT